LSAKVLLVCTSRWLPPPRLGVALANAGFTVEAVCPSPNPLSTVRCVAKVHPFAGLAPLLSLKAAVSSAKPDIIVPCDDFAVLYLRDLHGREKAASKHGSMISAVIERSLGSSASFSMLYERAALMDMAASEGIRTPPTQAIASIEELRGWASRRVFPIALKSDSSSGGEGVRIASSMEEAERAYMALSAPPMAARMAKRAVIDRDARLFWPFVFRRRQVVNAQVFVRGRDATSSVACWNGSVLASLHFEVVNKTSATGHSSVLRVTHNPEMSAAAEKIVRRLGLSGVHGFDFMIEAGTNNAYLIEMNPRATQVGHLTLGPGRDIPAALFAAVTGQTMREAPAVTENTVIALFPQEWKRDPASPYLLSGYHDVPWDEPELIRACVRPRRKQWARYTTQELVRGIAPARMPCLRDHREQ
jgi:Carbamoyl-phosphate synthase L chain, ATP binding domain